jgi:hypothetical protein
VADRSLGHGAYEKYVQVSGDQGHKPPWAQLRPPVRARWEAIATAVIEACGG